ncbi:ATP-binding protein [Armatimonas sp.]|uniref:ATP-binding protein n=1 Tax=Armatimonas sp. TaxID=1872638 RepID=UPI00286ABCA3|nr:ATP-binding protein [Armatimonas sp.]
MRVISELTTPSLLEAALSLPTPAIASFLGRRLTELFPDKVVVECSSCGFDLNGFVDAGHCTLTPLSSLGYSQVITAWRGCGTELEQLMAAAEGMVCATDDTGLVQKPENAFLQVTWEGEPRELTQVSWQEDHSTIRLYFLHAEKRESIEGFYAAVCEWSSVPHAEVLVFEQGQWRKDRALFKAIRSATFDNLILAPGLKEALRGDLTQFFARRDVYLRYGVPWKRGILLIGPPGNGKTHTVKALCNTLGVPALYLRSLEPRGMFGSEHESISQVFSVARKTAPCVLVLEDLDALLKPTNRSFFLNELDGFAENAGVCVVATTNYPERLDPAILERPSRFDRKYHFDLPSERERAAYLTLWNEKQTEALHLTDSGIAEVAATTEGFSFAYLKELCLAATMAWINAGESAVMDEIAKEQVKLLQSQMQTAPGEDEEADPDAKPSRRERFHKLMRGEDE